MARDDDYDYDDTTDDEAPAQQEPSWRKKLTRDRDTAKADALALRRENAFLKAGVNTDDPKAKYFVKGYDGELDAAAIKAEAQALGLLEAPAPAAPADDVPDTEKEAHQRISDTATGAEAAGARDFIAEMNAATSVEDFERIRAEAGVQTAPGAYTPPAFS